MPWTTIRIKEKTHRDLEKFPGKNFDERIRKILHRDETRLREMVEDILVDIQGERY